MTHKIITISREFGSGGRTIGKEVAKRLGIPCYDSELIQQIALKSGYSKEYIEQTEDVSSIFSNRMFFSTNEDYLWQIQCQIIQDLAEKEACVIVGRCADYILKDKYDCLNVFIHADIEYRAKRIVDVYGQREESPIQRIKEKDKRRKAYHRFYTDMKWGYAQNYDLCLNSGKLGINTCIELILKAYNKED